jgi:hypothetical protein
LVILETRNPVSDAGGSPGADAWWTTDLLL